MRSRGLDEVQGIKRSRDFDRGPGIARLPSAATHRGPSEGWSKRGTERPHDWCTEPLASVRAPLIQALPVFWRGLPPFSWVLPDDSSDFDAGPARGAAALGPAEVVRSPARRRPRHPSETAGSRARHTRRNSQAATLEVPRRIRSELRPAVARRSPRPHALEPVESRLRRSRALTARRGFRYFDPRPGLSAFLAPRTSLASGALYLPGPSPGLPRLLN